ncbi:S1 family peptidase [Nitrococcus mobilis]|uniref:Peptidase S1 and S6, chymotrypsin/Hap n=1 Tax=Nitrococcus mobilis Nb-231 TaxID=314278 RepID=A4BT63_9GAMM|nr:serine protease [Nitrococcus mobilis]EAR21131.1 Peptidase S1 and S6, chymotrypsin/Hap [Nitrococcus mobilis Nb-231]
MTVTVRFAAAAFAVVVLLGGGVNTHAELADTIERVKTAVVGVGTYESTRRPPAQFRGTGFAVDNGRRIITNAHVLPKSVNSARREYLAVFQRRGDRLEARKAQRIGLDRVHDLAVLEIKGAPFPSLKIATSEHVREGGLYAFTGFPIGAILGLYPVTHRGIISAITPIAIPVDHSRQLDARMIKSLRSPFRVYQLDATAYPGNSGSPLYDPQSGTVIGVINKVFVKATKEAALAAAIEQPSGISYAVPSIYIRKLLDRLD